MKPPAPMLALALAAAGCATGGATNAVRVPTSLEARAVQSREFETTDARLVLRAGAPGTVWFDMVSLFPVATWKDRPNGLRPDLYCKPIINSADDREALVAAATSGSPDWFLGTDSAPHPTTHKYTDRAKPGIFNAPFALPVVAEVFHRAGALSHLEAFVSLNGCGHYGYPPSGEKLRLTRVAEGCGSTGEPIPDSVVTADGQQVIIFGVDEARCWRVEWL